MSQDGMEEGPWEACEKKKNFLHILLKNLSPPPHPPTINLMPPSKSNYYKGTRKEGI